MTLHPTVTNHYTLLSLLPPRTKVYTRLDLKDAFSCVRLTPASQPIFAFEWEDPVGGTKQQLTWTPPQGCKNSPAIFGEALASDLNSFHLEELAPTIRGRPAAGCRDQGKMLERDKNTAPAADGSRLLGVKEGTDLQGGGTVSGVCFKEGHKGPDPGWVLYTDGTSLIEQGQRPSGQPKREGPPGLKRDGGSCQVADYWCRRSWHTLW